jgi:hypothetical protein
MSLDLRERQRPLKERYRQDPASARLIHSVQSVPLLDDPLRSRVTIGTHTWDVAAHAMAGGPEGEACSGDVLLAALAACQEITVKMVAAAMGIVLDDLHVIVTGEMDFRGTMGTDREVPVGYQRITCECSCPRRTGGKPCARGEHRIHVSRSLPAKYGRNDPIPAMAERRQRERLLRACRP